MLTIEQIKELIPHRYPFLLVDRVLEVTETTVKGYKNLTANEAFFNGHFPGAPIMPGVLQLEAMAQLGCILIMNAKKDELKDSIIVFTGINNAKFKRIVVPGDKLDLEIELGSIRRNFVTFKGKASVDGQLASSMEASAAILPKG
ncbi:MAG: 3-hydroxyacyl-ACP dehydratase FabZ [Bacteroidetes bacterium]|nr:3-hydroxyacyl-ACP dehydratase FabZ [Bacteroidota bacterium]NCQ11021.1 3-hydroxyacyl-ACP dehydratase FabZ [Bacteroidota bacterium]